MSILAHEVLGCNHGVPPDILWPNLLVGAASAVNGVVMDSASYVFGTII